MLQSTISSCDVLIIGAGVVGMLSALELAGAGQRVLIIDKGQAGLEASWAGGGIISPLYPWRYAPPITALATWSQKVFPDLIAQLRDSTGIDPELLETGMLVTATNEREQALAWLDNNGINNGHTLIALQWLARHGETLRQQWLS